MENTTESLIKWLKTFDLEGNHKTAEDLCDGVVMAQALAQIAPEYFNSGWLAKIKSGTGSNWRLKVSNLRKILKGILDYYNEALGQQIIGFKMPDVNAIGENSNPVELGRMLQLVLGCAVNCDRKQEYIEAIMELEEDVQHVVMNVIQELITKEIPTSYSGDSYAELNEQLKKTTEELQAASEAKEQISQRCHELDMQVAALQDEKATLIQENEKLLERLNNSESLEDPSTVAGKRFQQMQHKLEILQDEVYKLETARDEFKIKVDLQEKEILDLQQKNEDLQRLAEEARTLKDELDVLRHNSDKVEQYETTIETYKKKFEDLVVLKKQLKVLEDKNTSYMQQNMELEEELKKTQTLKSQVDMYKKRVQELHSKLSEETRKADKAGFENSRLSEKLSSIQREKERLVAERDSLKETIEELRCMQLQKEETVSPHGVSSNRPSGAFSDTDMLESVPPEIREKLIRLQHENKMLKLKQNGSDEEQTALLKTLLDDAKARQNELETENRLANQRILELEGQLQDLQENHSQVSSQEGKELRWKLNMMGKKQKEIEAELQKGKVSEEALQSQLEASVQKAHQLQELLSKKEGEMRAMEERYKKYLEKAKNVIRTLDPKQSTGSGQEVLALRNQLQEKEKIIAKLEKDAEKSKVVQEMEEKLLSTAFYNLGAQLQRKTAEERLLQNPTTQSFLTRQRQATTRRLTNPGVSTRCGLRKK
ncbi:hook microtubule tethering protein isoform X1 [Tachypleus tridentatus]|uniref:hook microtubule tethering protein isoform X1 n=1 Tax=Tachypleus tridentatus TaxID=6853 RepID=UPI003FD2C1B1